MRLIKDYSISVAKIILLATTIFYIAGCSKDDSPTELQLNEAYWKISSTVSTSEGSAAIIIKGKTGTTWNAEITNGTTWCSFSSKDFINSTSKIGTIKDGLNVLYVYYTANSTTSQRQATISVQFEGETPQVLDLNQLSKEQQNLPFTGWAEIPEYKKNSNYQYVTEYATINNKKVRNYSICYDLNEKAALWVAYPMHSAYLGSGGRTDAWAFEPSIPISYQPNCINRSYKGSYDRGHQIPSADRLATTELNTQTFYMSNMTPQLDRLNQDMWAKLEAKVRQNKCTDTLYVVTGAYFGSNPATTTDGAGNIVPIPTNYFKLLLRTKSGSTGKAIKDCADSELISIGFWVEHKSYGNIAPPRSICTSVAEIESKTGFKFFPQVSENVKQQNDPTQWGIN
ncbi:DNA/RNA non-specific endonuclease [uncultured Bacteroides sp.]|uniref:DNA/RNA non-specific endonuclease n=1 Tax=uncultured Bacteroides sp. TaxID=162156 RepID=UPI002AAAC259|nr:DNA/RNA non-specific endonuclease [uncultured Bacteroides sp.]